jgi:hypothetical protein
MGQGIKKSKKYESVRIWPAQKESLTKLIATRTLKGEGKVSEVELVSNAVEAFCQKENRKLGQV